MSKRAISLFWLCAPLAKFTESYAGRWDESGELNSGHGEVVGGGFWVPMTDTEAEQSAHLWNQRQRATSVSLQFVFSWGCFRTSDAHIWLTMQSQRAYCAPFSRCARSYFFPYIQDTPFATWCWFKAIFEFADLQTRMFACLEVLSVTWHAVSVTYECPAGCHIEPIIRAACLWRFLFSEKISVHTQLCLLSFICNTSEKPLSLLLNTFTQQQLTKYEISCGFSSVILLLTTTNSVFIPGSLPVLVITLHVLHSNQSMNQSTWIHNMLNHSWKSLKVYCKTQVVNTTGPSRANMMRQWAGKTRQWEVNPDFGGRPSAWTGLKVKGNRNDVTAEIGPAPQEHLMYLKPVPII